MNTGQLNRRINLQSRRVARDAMSGETVNWADEVATWAHFLPLSGRELIAAQGLHSEAQVQFTIRFRDDVTTDWRVRWNGRVYDIKALIDVDGEDVFLQLLCSEGLVDG